MNFSNFGAKYFLSSTVVVHAEHRFHHEDKCENELDHVPNTKSKFWAKINRNFKFCQAKCINFHDFSISHLVKYPKKLFVEFVFGWKGLGFLLFDALEQQDLPVVMGGVLVVSFVFVCVNALTDAAYRWVDPRAAQA